MKLCAACGIVYETRDCPMCTAVLDLEEARQKLDELENAILPTEEEKEEKIKGDVENINSQMEESEIE